MVVRWLMLELVKRRSGFAGWLVGQVTLCFQPVSRGHDLHQNVPEVIRGSPATLSTIIVGEHQGAGFCNCCVPLDCRFSSTLVGITIIGCDRGVCV
jgi:hypothetical protein